MAPNKIFTDLEKKFNLNFPSDMVKILTECGFDTEFCFSYVTQETINDIEEHVNSMMSILENTSYEGVTYFKLKPGHKSFLLNLPNRLKDYNCDRDGDERQQCNTSDFSYILRTFIETSEENFGKHPKGFRYNECNRYFSIFIYLLCGKSCYDTLSANLPIPQAQTIMGYINQHKPKIIEGELRIKELKHYLDSHNLEKHVWLSEDATAIVAKVEFDPKTNQMMGLVLPTDPKTGMPIPFTYLASSEEDIRKNMNCNKSTIVYIVMAQPVMKNIPAFVLQLFGSDNKFTTQDVLLRWKHTRAELERHGIEVAGFSGDGDARILKSMRYNSNFDLNIDENKWFGTIDSAICFLQDIVHIGTKLRNRLLDAVIFLLIGNRVASVAHLKMLINSVPKAVHGLVYSVICPDDRQNYNSLEKIMQPQVREALAKYIMGSEGTIEYIRICHEVTSSLYDDDLPPLERLLRIWRSTFFLRGWRFWLKQTPDVNLEINFISPNAYQCIELNAKNLVILVKKFRNEGLTQYFHPTIFNSQPCEESFRKLRSMTTLNFTKVNFTFLELTHIIGRLELMDNLMNFKLADVDIKFPRNPIHKAKINHFELPTDSQIDSTIKEALRIAIEDCKKFGMFVTEKDIGKCRINQVEVSFETVNQNANNVHIDLGIASSSNSDEFLVGDYLRDYSDRVTEESSSYVSVAGKGGETFVRKSTLMWSISNSKEKLSADRLIRVQSKKKYAMRQLEFVDLSFGTQFLCRNSEIKIGDWCVFHDVFKEDIDAWLLGNILSFRYMNGKTKKEKRYSWDFASIAREKNDRGIEVLASWQRMHVNGIFQTITSSFISIDNYVANMSCETVEKYLNGNICIPQNNLSTIQNALQNL